MAALLAGATQAAEPAPGSRCAATARFDLSMESPEMPPDVCVSADEPTTFFFDSRVAVGAVEFQPTGRLVDWAVGEEGVSILVIPKADYLPEERVRVTIRFADGTVPASASFWLVGHAAKGTRRVEVFRQPHPPEVIRRERDEARAEARQCQEDKARLLAERQGPDGLMGAAWMERAGSVSSRTLGWLSGKQSANALRFERGRSYSYTRKGESRPASVAVWLALKNPGVEPWRLAGAVLVDSTGEEVELARWQEAPIPVNGAGAVVVGVEGAPAQLRCPCTLKVWESPGARTFTLEDVTFPPVEQGGERE
ncbi:MAG: DUF2381 family protein [Cystobacter sp.]